MQTFSLEKQTALVVAVLLAWPASSLAQVLRGPYVQLGSHDRTTVVWRTLTPSDGRVWYGTSKDNLGWTEDSPLGFQHEVALTGLEPATRYWYAIGSANDQLAGGTSSYFFDTAPLPGTPKQTRIWIVGDSGTGGLEQMEVRNAAQDWWGDHRPDLFLHMGDMAYNSGEDLEFQFNFFAPYQEILRSTVCWPTMGNHEGKSSDSDDEEGPYYDAYVLPRQGEAGGLASGTEAYYAFDYANVHFIVMDSHDTPRTPGSAMLTWLQEDLAATDQEWIIAYWHHPPYTKGSHDSDWETAHIEMREHSLPILEAGGVDLIMGGHSHTYERSYLLDGGYDTPTVDTGSILDSGDGRPLGDGPYKKEAGANQGAVYVVAGHGGRSPDADGEHPLMYFTEAENGSCVIDLHGGSLTLHNIRKDGLVTDRFSLLKGDALLVTSPNGGEQLGGGDAFELTWASSGSVGAVDIDITKNGGETWTSLAESVPNTGSWIWDVPPGDWSARIRVSEATGPAFDESDGAFDWLVQAPFEAIPWGAIWRYDDTNVAPAPSWIQTSFDDASWPQGAAHLGYGDGDEVTELQDYDPNSPSYYFRKAFTLDHPVESASLEVIHDDGVAVWINGTSVLTKYMAFGTSHLAYASEQAGDNEYTQKTFPSAVSVPLKAGENSIAVMVKQRSEGSSDLSFDMRLVVAPDVPFVDPGGDTGDDGSSTTGGSSAGTTTGGEGATGRATGGSETGDGGASTSGSDGTVSTSDGIPAVEGEETTSGSNDSGCTSGGRPGSGPVLALLMLLGLVALRRTSHPSHS